MAKLAGTSQGARRVAVFTAVLLTVALTGPPLAAEAASGPVNTTAQGLRASIRLLELVGGGITLPLNTRQTTWQTGGNPDTASTANADLRIPLTTTSLLGAGLITATSQPDSGGGQASARVTGLNLLGASNVGANAVETSCSLTASGITGGTDTVDLTVLGGNLNPGVNANITIPGVLTGVVDRQIATYVPNTGRLTWTIRGLDLTLSGGLDAVAGGAVVVAESTCSGILKLDNLTTTARTIVPGTSGTPSVTVANTGDVAAPNTVITIPAPPSGYTVGDVTTSGGGNCVTGDTQIRCTGVTVPGQGGVTVSLPVTVASSALNAANWAPGSSAITAVSTPVAALGGTTLSTTGGGTLVTVGAPQSSGAFTVTPMTLAAGRNAATPITLSNQGPSDATTTVTIPIGNRPAGITVTAASVGGTACQVSSTTVTCSNVSVPARGSATVSLRAAATATTAPGTTWDLAGLSATLNGTAVSGGGRLLTVSDPDVNLNGGVGITPATGVPGGPAATATVRVANVGIVPATGTTITLPPMPAGYTAGSVTTTGGGTCSADASGVRCTGVTVPAMGAITVSIPVTLASNVTAGWTATTAAPVTATSGDSTGQATGPIVVAEPDWTLGIDADAPEPGTVRPGQNATMTVRVDDLGPSDAVDAEFVIVAPASTTFGPLTGTVQQLCAQLSPTTLRCTVSLPSDADPIVLRLPLLVSAQADPGTPLGGGCVSLNNDTDCTDVTDQPLPGIVLESPLNRRLTVTSVADTVVPGTSGTARVRLRSTTAETGLTVTVPLAQLPAGFTAGSGGNCTANATQVRCTGVNLTAGQNGEIAFPVTLASSVRPPARWTATAITVADADESVSVNGALALADDPRWTLTATIAGPPPGTVLPGGTGRLVVVAHNDGPSDAVDATFTVTAAASTTFETLTGEAARWCRLASSTRAVCTVNLADEADTPELYFPFRVDANADPYGPLPGACVDSDGDPGCDRTLDPIELAVPFDRQVALSYLTANPVPGADDVAAIRITARNADQNGLTLAVPLALPAGLRVTQITADPGVTCTQDAQQVVCSGIDITGGTTESVFLRVAANANLAAGVTWTATGVAVSRGADRLSGNGRLAVTAAPRYVLRATVDGPDAPVPPGGTGTLDILVTNDGPSDAPQRDINVLAPYGTTFGDPVAPTSTVCRKAGDTVITCTFAVPYGQPRPLQLPIIVSPDADPANPPTGGCVDLNNSGACDPGEPGVPEFEVATPFDRRIDISTIPATVLPGTPGIAYVRLTPTGQDPLTNLTVRVPLAGKPAEFTVTSATPSSGACTVDAVQIECTGVNVPTNGATIAIPVTVAGGAAGTLTWSSQAITVIAPGGGQAVGAGLLVRSGLPLYALTATVTGPPDYTVLPGGIATFGATIRNNSLADATNALVTVQAPVGTTWGELPASTDLLCDVTSPTRVTCRVTLAAGDSLGLELPARVPANARTDAALTGGCLDLDGNGVCDTFLSDDRPLPDLRLRTPLSRTLTVTADNPTVAPGTSRTATVTLAAGPAVDNLIVRILTTTLPQRVTATGPASCATVSDGIECTGISLTAGGTRDIPLTVTAAPDAVEGAAWTPPIRITRAAESFVRNVRTATVGIPEHDLTVVVRPPAPGTLVPGGTAPLDITVTNLGPAYFPGAVVEFEAPDGLTFVPPAAPLSQNCRTTSPTHVVCTFDLPVGPRDFQLVVAAPATAGGGGPATGGCVDNNGDNQCTQPPDDPMPPIVYGTPIGDRIALATTVGTAVPGTSGTGRIVIDSDVARTGATVTIPTTTLPQGFTGLRASGPVGSTCAVETGRIVCTGVNLPQGRNPIIDVTADTAPNLPAGRTWTAYSITVVTADGTVQDTGAVLRTIDPVAPITYTVDSLTGVVQAGGTATMTVTVHNDGPSDAQNVAVKVVAPSQTTFGSLSGRVADDCTRAGSDLLDCRFGQPASAADFNWIIPLLVSETAGPDDPVTGGCVSVNNDEDCEDPTDVQVPNFALGRPLSDVAGIDYTAATIPPGTEGQAQLVLNSDVDLDNLTLTVPLANLPQTFTVTGQTSSNGDCAQENNAVVCTGIDMIADTAVTVSLTIRVDATAATNVRWRGVGVTLADDDGSDPLTSSGLLASTSPADYDVVVTFGAPNPNPVAPGQTTRLPVTLHNNGPSDAPEYQVVMVLPQGMTNGSPLPTGCSASRNGTVVSCTRAIRADETIELAIPMVASSTLTDGDVLTGGCLDNVGSTSFDFVCGGPDDLGMPAITISNSKVDLKIRYLNPRPRAVAGGTIRLGLPYTNVGNDSAAGVRFTIDPPDGVRVTAADILLDASASGYEVAAATAGNGPSANSTVTADCTSAADGDENTVVCTGPDAAVGETSQLWMSLYVAPDAPTGRHPVTVTISTTSPEGNTVNNFAVAQLTIAGDDYGNPAPIPGPTTPSDNSNNGGGGWDNLPKTGQNVFGLIVMSMLLVIAGVLILAVARDRPKPDPQGTL